MEHDIAVDAHAAAREIQLIVPKPRFAERGMVGVDYIQNTLNEFLGNEQRELVVIAKSGKQPARDISKLASDVSGSEVTCVPTEERGTKDEE